MSWDADLTTSGGGSARPDATLEDSAAEKPQGNGSLSPLFAGQSWDSGEYSPTGSSSPSSGSRNEVRQIACK